MCSSLSGVSAVLCFSPVLSRHSRPPLPWESDLKCVFLNWDLWCYWNKCCQTHTFNACVKSCSHWLIDWLSRPSATWEANQGSAIAQLQSWKRIFALPSRCLVSGFRGASDIWQVCQTCLPLLKEGGIKREQTNRLFSQAWINNGKQKNKSNSNFSMSEALFNLDV